MKRLINSFILCCAIALSSSIYAQSNSSKSAKDAGLEILTENFIKGQINFLASDFMEGRGTIQKGGQLAAEYIASILEMNGIEPYGDMRGSKRSYFQTVPMTWIEKVNSSTIKVSDNMGNSSTSNIYINGVDFTVNPSQSTQFNAEMVFAGYGMIDEKFGQNDFVKADVKNKVVVVYSGFPSHKDSSTDAYKYFTENRYKNHNLAKSAGLKFIKDNGALAVVIIDTKSNYANKSVSGSLNSNFYQSEAIYPTRYRMSSPLEFAPAFQMVNVSPKLGANIALHNTSVDLVKYESKAMKGVKSTPIFLANKSIEFNADVVTHRVVGYNVVGVIKGKDSSKSVVIGGHYDHMGMKGDYIWNGADDNASGTIGVLAAAAAFMKTGETPECDIIFALWTAEELGLIGSKYFVTYAKELYPETEMVCNVNHDMLSRSYDDDKDKNEFDYEYSILNPEYKTYGDNNIKEYNLNLKPRYLAMKKSDYTGGTDYVPFKNADISFMGFYSGHHPDYHKISDELKNLDWGKFYDLVRLGFLNSYDIVKNINNK